MKKENIVKSLNDEILALSTLFEAGRISKKDFESLKKDAEEAEAKRVEALKAESAPKKLDYSADSDLPLTGVIAKLEGPVKKSKYIQTKVLNKKTRDHS